MITHRIRSVQEPRGERQASSFFRFLRSLYRVSQIVNDSQEREISHRMLRNEARARVAAAQMGTRYIGHPANRVQRIA